LFLEEEQLFRVAKRSNL